MIALPRGGDRISASSVYPWLARTNTPVVALSDERVAMNDVTFREANERIYGSAREYNVTDAIPFLCECADPACAAIIRLSAIEYNSIRADPRRFFSAPDHAEALPPASFEIAERHSTYVIVVAVGRAAEIADALDPRSAA
jgi:hypothetical protein